MDRRQKKTREAIMAAFTSLLAQKHYHQISVQEIIDAADVGRSTFYAHFETKDFLLREFCEELCDHIIETAHGHYTDAHRSDESIFLHLLEHIETNNQNITDLLSSPNNEIFLRYFKNALGKLICTQYADTEFLRRSGLPRDYLVNHVSSSFVETVYWWISHRMKESAQTVEQYFLAVMSFARSRVDLEYPAASTFSSGSPDGTEGFL